MSSAQFLSDWTPESKGEVSLYELNPGKKYIYTFFVCLFLFCFSLLVYRPAAFRDLTDAVRAAALGPFCGEHASCWRLQDGTAPLERRGAGFVLSNGSSSTHPFFHRPDQAVWHGSVSVRAERLPVSSASVRQLHVRQQESTRPHDQFGHISAHLRVLRLITDRMCAVWTDRPDKDPHWKSNDFILKINGKAK